MTIDRRQNMFVTNIDKWGELAVGQRHRIRAGVRAPLSLRPRFRADRVGM